MCPFCEQYDFDTIGVRHNHLNNDFVVYLCGGCTKTPTTEKFRFCPLCGEQIIYKENK